MHELIRTRNRTKKCTRAISSLKNARVRYNVIIEVKYGKYWIPLKKTAFLRATDICSKSVRNSLATSLGLKLKRHKNTQYMAFV